MIGIISILTLYIGLLLGSFNVASQNSTNSAATLIVEIIDEYYVLRQTPLLIVREHEVTQADLVDQIIRDLRNSRLVQLHATIHGYQSWYYALFFCTNYGCFQRIISQLRSEKFQILGYYTFVFNEISEKQIYEAFSALWRLKLLRSILIVADEDQSQLYNFSPYSNNTCGELTVNSIDDHLSSELFLHRLNDFYGCSLRLGTFESPPFVHFLPATQNQEFPIKGFEAELVTTLAVKLNFRLVVITPPDNAQSGMAHRHGSTGLAKILQDEVVHFGIGCLNIMSQWNEILLPGRAHYTSQVLFGVPDGQLYSPIEKLLRPYDRTVWIIMACLLGCVAVVTLILKFAPEKVKSFVYGRRYHRPFFNSLSVLFSGSVYIFPDRNFSRTLLILWIGYCFVMRTVYQGLLFRYLQDESSRNPVDTIDEIERSDLHYYITWNSASFFDYKPELLERARYIYPGNDSIGAALDAVSSRRVQDGVVLATLEHIAYHNKHHLDQGFIQSTRDSLRSYPMVIYYPKRTFLVQVFNRLIGDIETAGLMNYWVRLYGNYHFFPKKIIIAQPTPLTLHHLVGSFAIILALWILSFVAFILEVLSLKVKPLRKILEFLIHRQASKSKTLFLVNKQLQNCIHLKALEAIQSQLRPDLELPTRIFRTNGKNTYTIMYVNADA